MSSRPLPSAARRNNAAREAILDAARELVLSIGYARLTIEGIAAKAGVGKQTIYRWWSSKGAVVFEAFLALDADARGRVELPDSGNIERDLKDLLRATVKQLLEPGFDAAYRALAAEIQSDVVLAKQLVETLLGPQMQATVDRLKSAQRAKQLRSDLDLFVATEMLFGPLFHRWLLRTAPLDDAFADKVATTALRAFTL